MNTNRFDWNDDDPYAHYEAQFQPRPRRKVKAHHQPKKSQEEILDDITDLQHGLEGGFQPSYKPSHYESTWLLQSLQTFYDQHLISDIEALIKGGKEATVYRCTATEAVGLPWIAAKVYRPRQFRQLRNDKMYREGRAMLKDTGAEWSGRDTRMQRALEKGSRYGAAITHTSWLMYEFNTLDKLYQLGAAVPKPVAVDTDAILMEYLGDDQLPAPLLHSVRLERDEVKPLFAEVIRNIDLMLQNNVIHGDLSAYNILYWEGDIKLIDFPQVVNPHNNPNAAMILRRDIERMCQYFGAQGMRREAGPIFDDLWGRYVGDRREYDTADFSRLLAEDDRDDPFTTP